jgi:hypothetical protein
MKKLIASWMTTGTQVQRVNSRNRSAEPDEPVIFGTVGFSWLANFTFITFHRQFPIYHKGSTKVVQEGKKKDSLSPGIVF